MTLEELEEVKKAHTRDRKGWGIAVPGTALHDELFDLAEAMLMLEEMQNGSTAPVVLFSDRRRSGTEWTLDPQHGTGWKGDTPAAAIRAAYEEWKK